MLHAEESPMYDGIDKLSVEQFLLLSPDHIHAKKYAPLTDEECKNYTHNDLMQKAEQLFYSISIGDEQTVTVENST